MNWIMKNLKKIVLILLLVMIASLLIGGIGLAMEMAVGKKEHKEYNIDEKEQFAADQFEHLSIKTIDSEINILPATDNQIKIHFHGFMTGGKKPDLQLVQSGKTLKIKIKHYRNTGFFIFNITSHTQLDVYLPVKNWKSLVIKSVSGDQNLGSLKSESLNISSVSGKILGDQMQAIRADMDTTSGDIKLDSLSVQRLIVSTTSGTSDLGEVEGEIEVYSVSGSIRAELLSLKDNINLDTTSGNCILEIPAQAEFEVDFSSVSGNFDSDFSFTVSSHNQKKGFKGQVGSGDYLIKVKTVSGRLKIKQK
ncbi:MAG: DUF4097 domain-containing protein [Spirochaetes bacterium]|nr:DUF4097 domain-containing protein [Spirochaetota bacterium]